MDSFSDALYATPSFLEGAARIMDVTSSMDAYNSSPTPEEADGVSLAMDWAAVGHYIRSAADEELSRPQGVDADSDGLPSCL